MLGESDYWGMAWGRLYIFNTTEENHSTVGTTEAHRVTVAPKGLLPAGETARMLLQVMLSLCPWGRGGRAMVGPYPSPTAPLVLTHLPA